MTFIASALASVGIRRKFPEVLIIASFLAFSMSCAAPAVTGFQWKDESGASLAFSESSSRPAGEEGRFTDAKSSDRYVLAKALTVDAGRSIVVKIRREAGSGDSARVRLSLSAKADASSPLVTASFPIQSDEYSLYLPLETSSSVLSLAASAEGANAAFEIRSIDIAPAFKGIERGVYGINVSSGFTLVQGKDYSELSIKRPFASLGAKIGPRESSRPGILLEYGSAPALSSFRLDVTSPGGGKRSYVLRSHPSGSRSVLDESIVPADTELLTLRAAAGVEVKSFFAAEQTREDYDLADLGRVLVANAPQGDYSLYRWDMIPSVLVFDFKDYATQDRYLKRLAFFVEKAGFRGVLAKDEEIASLHGWNAHDYRAEDLASFFQAAREMSFPLDAEEKELGRLLAEAGILRESGGKTKAGMGAMISIARESSAALRWTFAVHESTHAIFFADPEYRSFAQSLWASLDSGEKWFWKTYFGWAGYDAGSDYLMGNEFQAYLLQQPIAAAEEYFTQRKSAELLEKHPELTDRVNEYMAKYSSSFAQRAKRLERRLFAKYGVEAGRTIFLTPIR